MENKFISREILPELQKQLKVRQVIVITGMRRVGKTTLLQYLYESEVCTANKTFLDLEDTFTRSIFEETNYENTVLALSQRGLDFAKKSYIFIDEVQLVPNISSVIKYLYDRYDIKFVVSGSSSYYLKNHFTESLSGRKFITELYPLTFNEFLQFKGVNKNVESNKVRTYKNQSELSSKLLSEQYNDLYQEYVDYGGFPEVVMTSDTELKIKTLKDISNSYFNIDVTTLADFETIGILKKLLMLLTQRVGQKINITNLAKSLGVKRQKVYKLLEFLQSTYVIKLLTQKTSIDNKVSAEDKLYFVDTGFAKVFADISRGSQLENSVFMNLVYHELNYYQTSTGGEIDFVVDKTVGLEVKMSPSLRDLATLKMRAKSAKLSEFYLVGFYSTGVPSTIMAWNLQ